MIPKVYLNPKLSLYERRRQLIAVYMNGKAIPLVISPLNLM